MGIVYDVFLMREEEDLVTMEEAIEAIVNSIDVDVYDYELIICGNDYGYYRFDSYIGGEFASICLDADDVDYLIDNGVCMLQVV